MKIPDIAYACIMQLQTRIMVLTLQFTMPALGCEGGIMQNQYAKQRLKPVFYFYFDIFIFENKSSRGKCN
jgi:hypothetical protein